jgi:LysM repeat protein
VQKSIIPETPMESPVSKPTTISGQGTDKNVEPEPQVIYHTVKSGENLYRIALKYYHSKAGEDIIRKANNISGNEIYLGQVLKIPLNK